MDAETDSGSAVSTSITWSLQILHWTWNTNLWTSDSINSAHACGHLQVRIKAEVLVLELDESCLAPYTFDNTIQRAEARAFAEEVANYRWDHFFDDLTYSIWAYPGIVQTNFDLVTSVCSEVKQQMDLLSLSMKYWCVWTCQWSLNHCNRRKINEHRSSTSPENSKRRTEISKLAKEIKGMPTFQLSELEGVGHSRRYRRNSSSNFV